jgi:PAS domain S-box-containing protein
MPAFAEQESQRVFQSLEENRKLQTCQGVETVLQKRYGQPIQVEIWTSLLGNQEGVAEGIILIVADITGRKAAENALQESQERLRLALVAARVGVWELDPIHQELSLSDRAREILGTQGQPRIPYRSLLEGVVAGDRARVHETFEARLSSDESSDFTLEFEFHPRAGEWRFIVVHGRKLSTKARGEGVASERLIGTVADNTERKKAEALLLEQNRRLQLLSEATGYLLKTENTEEMLCTLFRRLSDVFGFEFCSTHVLSSSGDYLELSTTSGDTRLNSVARVELSHPVFGRALLEQEAITWSGGSLSGDAEEVFKSSGIAALVAFPLKAGERLLGVLSFGSSKGITWSASDLEFLGTIADHVSVAKDRMQLLNAFVTRAQQLAQSEAEFRQLADSMPQIVWSASPAGSFEYLNRRWAEVTGQTAPADGVVEWDRFLHPDDVPSWAEYWAQSLASGHPFQMEYRLRDRVSGEFRWHLGRAVPVAAEGGKIGGWFGTSTDIHDQKCAQLRLRILSDASALLNWSHDYEFALRNVARLVVPELADWCIIEVAVEEEEPRSMVAVVHQESAKVQLFRHSREQLGVPLLSPAHREGGTPGPLLEISGAALQEIWSGYAESEVVKTLGWQSMVCFPLQARDRNFGTLTVAMAESRRRIGPEEIEFFVDLASRAAVAVDNARLAATAEQQRRVAEQNERYYRTLSETIPHLVWTGNNLGIIDDCNSRWTEYTGLTAEDTVAHGWSHVIHPDDRDRALETWQQSIASGEAFEIECRFRRASDSSYRWHIGRALPLRDALGNNMKWFGTWTDIHDQKSAENALKMVQEQLSDYAMHLEERVLERTAELQETIKSLEGFCYSIAHDLRAPLRATKGFTRILLEEYASGFDETGRDYANRIIEATSRMDRLIQDLLDYGRLAHVELSFDSVDLNSVVRMVLKVLADEITAKQGVVTVMPDMPAVLANPVVLEQILVNLVGNSLKFVTPGSSPQIEINAVARPENRVVISVKDHGIGIAKEHQERIFRVFERLNVKEFPGTGIGLAIVQKGVERMGGKVWVESEPGLGSCFSFDLPTPEHRPTLLDRRARLEKARQVQTPEPGLRAGA